MEIWISNVLDMSDVELHDARYLPEEEVAMEMIADASVVLGTNVASTGDGDATTDGHLTVRAEVRFTPHPGPPTHMAVLHVEYSG